MTTPQQHVALSVRAVAATDELGARHREQALEWLASTEDIYRRVRPATPPTHLVAYFLLVDRRADRVLLCDHRLAGLWLPTGGHVEPGEDPVDTVRREAMEELGVSPAFDALTGAEPFFLTVTPTVGDAVSRHVDVSLWFALEARVGAALRPDAAEFAGVRWWSRREVEDADPSLLEPHLMRALDALALCGSSDSG